MKMNIGLTETSNYLTTRFKNGFEIIIILSYILKYNIFVIIMRKISKNIENEIRNNRKVNRKIDISGERYVNKYRKIH